MGLGVYCNEMRPRTRTWGRSGVDPGWERKGARVKKRKWLKEDTSRSVIELGG